MGAVDEIAIRVLGAPAVVGERRVAVRGARQVGLLALLAVEAGRRIGTYRLEDELWDGRVVSDAALRVTVNRLRRRFDAAGLGDPVRSDGGGYLLDLAPDRVDLLLLERLAAEVRDAYRAGRRDEVLAVTARALALRSGRPFDGLAEAPTAALAADRADRACADLAVCRAGALLGGGREQEALDTLETAAPLARHREDLVALQMVAADRLGRRDLALAAFDRLGADLLDDVGVGPGARLAELRAAVETGDPLRRDQAAEDLLPAQERARSGGTRAWWRPAPGVLVGRSAELREVRRAVEVGRVSLVEAEAGFGKTAVVTTVAAEVAVGAPRILRIQANRLDAGPAPVLRALAAVAPGAGQDGPVPPDADGARLLVHASASSALASASPDLVVVEDVHWMDADALELVAELIRTSPVPWILTLRPSGSGGAVLDRFREDLRSHDRDRLVEIRLGPLEDDEIEHLVRGLQGTADGRAVTAAVVERAEGWPLLAVELCRHLDDLDAVPDPIRRAVQTDLASLDEGLREVVETLAVLGAPVEPRVLVGEGAPAARTVDGLVASGLVRLDDGRLTPTHEVVREAIVDGVEGSRLATLHLASAQLLASDDGASCGAVLRHLLAAGPAARDELESRIGPLLAELKRSGAVAEAGELAARYLTVAGAVADSTVGIAGRVEVASCLLSDGRVEEGLALLDSVMAPIRRLDDPVLLAAAMLARGPVDVGAGDDPTIVAEALELRHRLPVGALDLRVRLACWGVHQCITAGVGDERVDEILDHAESDAAASGDDELRAMVLGIRYQAAAECDRRPDEAAAAFENLRRWSDLTGRVSTRAMVRLFALDRTGTEGTLEDHRRAVDELEDICRVFPRPDVRWCVDAARAGAVLAAGDLDAGAELVAAAAETGRRRQVRMAEGVERLQQYLLLDARGLLPALAPLFDRPFDELGPPVMAAVAGRVASEAGEPERAAAAAAYLAARPRLLSGSGAGWPVLAHVASELAAHTSSSALGERLLGELGHRRGTSLSAMGLVLLGSVDRMTGLASLAVGDRAGAVRDLERAAARDRAAGMRHWADRAGAAAAWSAL